MLVWWMRLREIIIYYRCNDVDLTTGNVRRNSFVASMFQCVICACNLCITKRNHCFPHATPTNSCIWLHFGETAKRESAKCSLHQTKVRIFVHVCITQLLFCRLTETAIHTLLTYMNIYGFCNVIISSLIRFICSLLASHTAHVHNAPR